MNIIVAITGASGAIYGIRLLEELKNKGITTHLLISKWGRLTIETETDYSVGEVKSLASHCYDEHDLSAVISSGSFKCDGMVVSPCSMKTLSGISSGYSDDLITRAADVTIKEGRRLVLMVRETPLSAIHLENMLKLARIGVIIMPPVPAFYSDSHTIEDIVNQSVGRAMDLFGLEMDNLKRWGS
jgi:4-hydroxy-3-polyprenylbenzoate decarboxylase